MNALTATHLVLELAPHVIRFVKDIEEILPEKGMGKLKLAMVRSAMESMYQFITDFAVAFEHVWPILEEFVSRVVKQFNETIWKRD